MSSKNLFAKHIYIYFCLKKNDVLHKCSQSENSSNLGIFFYSTFYEKEFSTKFSCKCPYSMGTEHTVKENFSYTNRVYLRLTENIVGCHVCVPLHSRPVCPTHLSPALPHLCMRSSGSPFKTCLATLSSAKPSVTTTASPC